ncbi:MAG TPA: hypothetical protein VE398_00025, partial [Acidobacteriota bacterium]|nr:hypothetical protein [Acidobacteriota bacterium]
MKKLLTILILLILTGLAGNVFAGVKLPQSMRLAGPLDGSQSAFGDEFYNFPAIYNGRAIPGRTRLNGWLEFRFSPPVGNLADFIFMYSGVGGHDQIYFPGGQSYVLDRNRAFNNDWLESKGTLNLDTGEATIEVHSIFRNTIIARVDKANRIPFGFPSDYPPLDLPVPLPFTDRPSTALNFKFIMDSAGNITGANFGAQSVAPVTVLPGLGLFINVCFGLKGAFYFATPTLCLPGTPPENCPNDQNSPDGLLLSSSAFFHPHFELVSSELHEVPQNVAAPPALPGGTTSPAGLVAANGRLYYIGGLDPSGPTNALQVYDPAINQWGTGAPMPTAVTFAQTAAVGSRIYVVGGWSEADGTSTNIVQVFDAAINRWTRQQAAPIPVFGGVSASVGGRIFIIGGWTNGGGGIQVPTNQVHILDTATGEWTTGTGAPLAVAGASIAVIGSDIYLIGGITADHTVANSVSIYSTTTNSWSAGPSALRGVYEAAAGYIGNRIYLVGGRLSEGGTCDTGRIQILDVLRGVWQDGHEQPIPTAAGGSAVLNGKFYTAGGRTMVGLDLPPGDITDVVQRYDPELGWFPCNSRPLFTSATVMNAASGPVGPVELAPGTRAVILGYNLASSTVTATGVSMANGFYTTDLPTALGGVSITVNGRPAPIFSVSPEKVEFQIPYDIPVSSRFRSMVPLALIREGSPIQAPPVQIALIAAAPGIYVYNYGDYSETYFMDGASAVARHADGKLIHPSQTAHPGETIALQVTGLGLVDPLPQNGQRAWDDQPNEAIFSPKVTIGGKDARVVAATLKA